MNKNYDFSLCLFFIVVVINLHCCVHTHHCVTLSILKMEKKPLKGSSKKQIDSFSKFMLEINSYKRAQKKSS